LVALGTSSSLFDVLLHVVVEVLFVPLPSDGLEMLLKKLLRVGTLEFAGVVRDGK
jgi:hypothetical protein